MYEEQIIERNSGKRESEWARERERLGKNGENVYLKSEMIMKIGEE